MEKTFLPEFSRAQMSEFMSDIVQTGTEPGGAVVDVALEPVVKVLHYRGIGSRACRGYLRLEAWNGHMIYETRRVVIMSR